jgi:hypothetical protein
MSPTLLSSSSGMAIATTSASQSLISFLLCLLFCASLTLRSFLLCCRSLSSQSPFLDPSLLATKVVSLFNSLPVSIPPEDVRGIGIHITKLAHHDYLQTPKAVPTRQLFPLSTVPRPPRQDPERQRSETRQNSSSSGGYVVPSLSQIDREVLTQLPEDVKHEIKRSLPPRLPPPPKPGKRTRTLVTCFEANAGSISKRSLTRGVDGTGRPFTPQRANRVAAPPVKEGEVRSPFSLTQQVLLLFLLPFLPASSSLQIRLIS